MKVGVHACFWISVFVFFGKIPRSGVSGLYGSPVFIFLRRLHTVFISGCTNLHSHRRCTGVPLSPHPRQRSLSAASRSDRCETVPRAALIYISLRISDVDHSFMFFFFCIRKSSLKDCPLTSSAHVGVALFALLMLSLWALCMFCLLTPCQIDCFPMQ